MKYRLTFLVGFALVGCVLISGCTKDKAEAIMAVSGQFRDEASIALHQIRTLITMSLEMPANDPSKMVEDLEELKTFSDKELTFLINESKPDTSGSNAINGELASIEKQYDTFASMFSSLSKGFLFSVRSVQKAQEYAIRLTIQMINLANELQTGKIRVRCNAKRIILVEQVNLDKAIKDSTIRKERLLADVRLINELGQQEESLKKQALLQCFKVAEIGRQVAELIRNYDKLSIHEILAMGQQALSLGSQLTGQPLDLVRMLDKYKSIETSIRNDSYWSQILSKPVTP
jgi:hypothetical protein